MSTAAFRKKLRRAEAALAEVDPALGRVIARVGPCPLNPEPDFEPFNALLRSICFQQLHGKAAETIHRRVATRLGDGEQVELAQVLRARLPTLRSCGLSESKAYAIKDLALKTRAGVVPSSDALYALDDEAIISRLTEVRGVGRWTVEMLLMFHMGRLDIFPVDDFGVRKGFMRLRGLDEHPTAKALRPEGARWAPWRTVASWYLWRLADGR